jgi:hypothetical protein
MVGGGVHRRGPCLGQVVENAEGCGYEVFLWENLYCQHSPSAYNGSVLSSHFQSLISISCE